MCTFIWLTMWGYILCVFMWHLWVHKHSNTPTRSISDKCRQLVSVKNDMAIVEGCFLVSSLEFCPAYRRGQWRFVLWAHCASVFVCGCLLVCVVVYLFSHTPGINKAHGYMAITQKHKIAILFDSGKINQDVLHLGKVLVQQLLPRVWAFQQNGSTLIKYGKYKIVIFNHLSCDKHWVTIYIVTFNQYPFKCMLHRQC